MKKTLCILFICNLVFGSVQSISNDSENHYDTINDESYNEKLIETLSIPLELPKLNIIGTAYEDQLSLDNFGKINSPGKPQLPQKIISIAIPPNAKPIKVSYTVLKTNNLNGSYKITPAPIPQTFDNAYKTNITKEYTQNYHNIFDKNEYFPAEPVTFVRQSSYRNYNLVDIKINPILYNPITENAIFYSDLNIDIEYKIYDEPLKSFEESQRIESRAKQIIYNYDQIQQWYNHRGKSDNESYNIVIITLDSLVDSIQSLVSWEKEKGNQVNISTVEWIDDQYQGIDQCQRIRNFLRDKYPNDKWGIEDVILIGHWDDIPMRKTYQSMGEMNDENMPETDYYYAELSLPDNESWDANQNNKFGEDSSDPIDFYSEVNVGRIPWSEPEIVQHICEKTVAYEKNTDPSFKNNILLLANIIDRNTDGATFMEYCVNSTIHPWMKDWMKTRMYERDSTYPKDYVLTNMNVRSVWSSGTYGIVSWHSHGGPYGSGNFISVNDCQYLNDEFPAIISAASCSNSDTNYPNIGQAMIKQGAVGFLGANKATPYQTEWDDPLDGSDQSLKYYFISSITSGEKTQGQAHQYALSEMYQKGLWFDLKYETFVHGTLFGSPTIGISSPFKNNKPEKPNTPEGPNTGKIRQTQRFTTKSVDPDGDQLYYGWFWGEDDIEWFGPYQSNEEITIEHTWFKKGNYDVKVKAKDEYGTESNWSDPLKISMVKNKFIDNWMLEVNDFFDYNGYAHGKYIAYFIQLLMLRISFSSKDILCL